MAIFPLAPDQTIAQMWSNGVRGGAATGLSSWHYRSLHTEASCSSPHSKI